MKGNKPNKIRLLILAKDLNKYQKAAQFLSRRGWPTDAVTNIKQAVEHVVKHRPTFVLVSMSHPNPNVAKLPNLLVQTFNASCIAFGETSDTKTLQRLNNSKLKYVFHGAMSGPSIHMRIKKILLDEENEKRKAERAALNPQEAAGAEGDLGAVASDNGSPFANANSVAAAGPTVISGSQDGRVAQAGEPGTFSYGNSPSQNHDQQGGQFGYQGGASNNRGHSSPEEDEDNYWSKSTSVGENGEALEYANDQANAATDLDYSNSETSGESENYADFGNSGRPFSDENDENLYAQDSEGASGVADEFTSATDSYLEQGGDFQQANHADHHGQSWQGVDSQNNSGEYSDVDMDSHDEDGNTKFKHGVAYMPDHLGEAEKEQKSSSYFPNNMSEAHSAAEGPVYANDFASTAEVELGQSGDRNSLGTEEAGDSLSAVNASHDPYEGESSSGGSSRPDFGNSPFAKARQAHEEQMRKTNMSEAESYEESTDLEEESAKKNYDPAAMGSLEGSKQNYHDHSEGSNSANQHMSSSDAVASNREKLKKQESNGPEIRKGAKAKVASLDFDPLDPFVNPGDMFFDHKRAGLDLSVGNHYTIPPALVGETDFILQDEDLQKGDGGEEEEIECNVSFRNGLEPDKHLKAIAAVVESGFKNACHPSSDDPMSIRKPSTVGIITAKYENKMGYILVALPQDCEDTEGFLAQVKTSIEGQKKVKNVEIKLHAEFYSHIDPVEFVEWAKNFAEFVSTLQHKNMEVAMAFVSTTELPNIRKAADKEGMYVVSVENIVADIPVNYIGYINMQKNEKMIQYIKNGRSISTVQKDRLKDKRVEDIYISESDTYNFKAHYASALLNKLIKQYNESSSNLRHSA